MPNLKSAIKRTRTTERRAAINRLRRSRITTARGKIQEAVTMDDKAKAELALKEFCSAMDKAAQTNVVSKNKADRSKSRATKRVAALA
jgi:small subunit ribosomal protein S20